MKFDINKWVSQQCQNFEHDFAQNDVEGLVEGYYNETPLVIADGIGLFQGREGAMEYFSLAKQQFEKASLNTKNIIETASGYLETGYVELTPFDHDQDHSILEYVVTWRLNNAVEWRVALDYFTPAGSPIRQQEAEQNHTAA